MQDMTIERYFGHRLRRFWFWEVSDGKAWNASMILSLLKVLFLCLLAFYHKYLPLDGNQDNGVVQEKLSDSASRIDPMVSGNSLAPA